MPSRQKVQNARFSRQLHELHLAVLDIVAALNRPQGDERLIREAAIPLERALFPLLVLIERFGPIGVGALADRVGRDYTTVSRQVAKLEELDLVMRRPGAHDRRVSEAVIASKGRAMTDAVDKAREKAGRDMLAGWDADEVAMLVRLMRKFADALTSAAGGA